MLKGESSRPETATYKDYTKTYFTDYSTEGKTTQGRVTQGKVHKLTAKATTRVALPIEYVTEHNLAGGEGLTYTLNSRTLEQHGFTSQPAGIKGPLRFASSHNNDQSGYYNFYRTVGRYHEFFNHNSLNLSMAELIDTNGSRITLQDKYFIPVGDQWWGVFPSPYIYPGSGPYSYKQRSWTSTDDALDELEVMSLGSGKDLFRQSYLSDYSKGFINPSRGSYNMDHGVLYAIRFKAPTNSCRPVTHSWGYDINTGSRPRYTYPASPDNSLKCAYRFTHVGGEPIWSIAGNQTAPGMHSTRLIIDVVYLGEETNPTDLGAISDEAWWTTKRSEGRVLSRVFPFSGKANISNVYSVASIVNEAGLSGYGIGGSFRAITDATPLEGALAYLEGSTIGGDGSNPYAHGKTIRLFRYLGR